MREPSKSLLKIPKARKAGSIARQPIDDHIDRYDNLNKLAGHINTDNNLAIDENGVAKLRTKGFQALAQAPCEDLKGPTRALASTHRLAGRPHRGLCSVRRRPRG